MSNSYTVGSMFAGIGGICLAFKKNGCKLIWANEIDSSRRFENRAEHIDRSAQHR